MESVVKKTKESGGQYVIGGGAPHVDTIIEYWSILNNCATTENVSISHNTNAFFHSDGINGNEVLYYKIDNYGHA